MGSSLHHNGFWFTRRHVSSRRLMATWNERRTSKKCVRDAIASGILSDGYSGSQVDLVVITKDKTDYLRAYDVVCDKGDRIGKYGFKPGTTPVVHQKVEITAEVVEEVVETMES